MNIRIFLRLLVVILIATPLIAAERHQLFYEIRAPKTAKLADDTHLELVTDQGSCGTRLHLAKKREEDGFVIYSESCLLHPGERRRAVIFRPVRAALAQVFVLTIPRTPKPADWIGWKRPNYVEKSDASWTFMHDLKQHERSTNLPPDCLEMRYRITDWKSP